MDVPFCAVYLAQEGETARLAACAGGAPAGFLVLGASPRRAVDEVFTRFYRVEGAASRAHEGTGTGLALVQRLARMHGGDVAAHSEGHGRGAELVVRLPLAEREPAAALPEPAVQPGPDARRILLVEDNDDARATLQALLEHLGHRVEAAVDGRSGLERLLALRPDVALIDVGLPGIDGYEVARSARAAPGGGAPYLAALTGYGGADARAKAQEAGFDRHVVKPLDLEELPRLLAPPPRARQER